ncbi:MAG: adenosine deaminase family protein [Deltaproteobacteria bacterium]|nr:adenosine deaminase family protein [Deltaproteobacteria bacterium]
MNKYKREFLTAIPKTDLHVHLDGSLRIPTLIELANDQKIKLPSYTEEGLRELVFKEQYADLVEFLLGFQLTAAVMQTSESLERVAYEFALDNFAEGVRYVEPRFAPQQHSNASISVEDVIASVDRGLQKAKKEINSRKEIAGGDEPKFEYGIICCALRMFNREFPGSYRRLIDMHQHMPKEDLYGLAALDLVQTMIYVRNEMGVPIVGFDLAGAEMGYPAGDHKKAYDLAHKNFFNKTVHAGEAYGPESIFQAITDCHADRIGHGTHIFDDSMVGLPNKDERLKYVKELWQYVADSRITVEVCLTSNLQTMPKLKSIKNHPVAEMLDKRLSFTFCTDNRLVSNTTMTDELELAVNNLSIPPRKLKDLIIYGFKRSFFSEDYLAKRRYVRDVINYYESVEAKYGITES